MRIIEASEWELRGEERMRGAYEFQMSSCSGEALPIRNLLGDLSQEGNRVEESNV